MKTLISLLVTWIISLSAMGGETEIKSKGTDQKALSLTVYNNNLALVRDTRIVSLPQGPSRLAFVDVSAQIRPETARLYGDIAVLEQNFDFDLLSPQKLLEKYVGREIGLVRMHPQTGEETMERGTLLSVANNGVVFRIGDRIETGGNHSPWRFVFDEVPDNLRERPTLTMAVESPDGDERPLQLAYLTAGLSWKADYVATLENGDHKMDLTGWVTLNNTSGASYRNASLQLLAGDVSQVQEEIRPMATEMVMARAAAPAVKREELFEYHLYTVERPTTIADRQTKQVLLMRSEQIPFTREYRIDTHSAFSPARKHKQELNAQVRLRFTNTKPALGEPLPAGIVRFYQRDSLDATQFIGESRIEHTPTGREVVLTVGSAFDITATRRQISFKKGPGNERESAWEVEVFNAKKNPVEVKVLADFPGEWRILEENLPHELEDADTARWTVEVPAKGQSMLSYRVWTR